MASTYTLKSNAYQGRYLQLSCTQVKDTATNSSVINWTLSSVGGSSNYYSTGATTVTINGTVVYNLARKNWDTKVFPAAKGSVSGSLRVSHDVNTGKKTVSVSLKTAIYVGESSATTNSGTWTLDDIARQATITSAPEIIWDTDNPTISFSNPANCPMDVWLEPNPVGTHLCERTSIPNTGSYTWVLTDAERDALRKQCPKDKCTIRIGLYSHIGGSKYADYKDKVLKIKESDGTRPTVTMNISLNNGSLPSTFADVYIQGKTRLNISLTAQGKYGASISFLNTIVGNQGYSTMVGGTPTSYTETLLTDAITQTGNISIKGSATDSRGFTGSATKQINVLAYSKPKVDPIGSEKTILCYRSDGNGKKVGGSSSVWIKAKRTYHNLSGKNTCALKWRRRLITSDAWEDWKDLIPKSNTSTNEYNALIQGVTFELNRSYAIQIRAIDDIGEYDTTNEFEIPTQDVALHLGEGGKKVAVGTFCTDLDDYTFYSEWKAIFDKGVYIGDNRDPISDFITERGTKTLNGITWTYRKYRSGDVMCEAVIKMEGCIDITAFTGEDYSYKALTMPFEFDGMPNIHLTGMSTAAKDVYGNIAYSVRDYTSTGFNIQQTCKASVKEAWVSAYIIGKLK